MNMKESNVVEDKPPIGKFGYSISDRYSFTGKFDTRLEALNSAKSQTEGTTLTFFVGQYIDPPAPEDQFNTMDFIEQVLCMDEYDHDSGDDWLDATKDQQEELEKLVRPIIGQWLNKHELRPEFWIIDEVIEYKPDGTLMYDI